MASPMLDGRSLNPRERAHFSLHISDRIANNDNSLGAYSSIKYNHKPSQTSSTRNTTLTSTSTDRYALRIQDKDRSSAGDSYTFTGQRTVPKKSYILLLDPTAQRATLEPLESTYTFNLSTKNRSDVSSSYTKIYPRKQKEEQSQDTQGEVFDEGGRGADDGNDEPDADNPYDVRHFLAVNKEKRGDESEYNIPSSPDYRTGTGSAANTPLMPARKPAAAVASKAKTSQSALKARKRKSPGPDPLVSRKASTKKRDQATPTVRLQRKASTRPNTDAKPAKKGAKATTAPASKIKSAETIHSSDDSDIDAEGELVSSTPPRMHRSPSPARRHHDSGSDNEDDDRNVGGALEIVDPDAAPKHRHGALASLGLGQNLGLGGLSHLRSPSNGPISLASAANSVEGSPNPAFTPRKQRTTKDRDVVDFDAMRADSEDEEQGGYEEDAEGEDDVDDRDVEPMDIGPPAQSQSAHARKVSVGGLAVEEDEDDPLYKEMMEGLAGGESSEESEEE